MTAPRPVTLRVHHHYSASAERVFDAWLDPKKAGQFLFATEKGQMVRAEIDPRVGGKFMFVDRRDGEDVEHFGEYEEIVRPKRLVFNFAVTGFPIPTRVTVEIASAASGCDLTLIHEGVPQDSAERSEGGWKKILEKLGKELQNSACSVSLCT